MLCFSVFSGDKPAKTANLEGAYLVGSDGVPLRADIEFRDGIIVCRKRTAGPAALAVLWEVPDAGRILLETTRLPERKQPYNLAVELLRGRLMRIVHKLEEWNQYETEEHLEPAEDVHICREALLNSIKEESPWKSAEIAMKGLSDATLHGEQLALHRADTLIERRLQQPHAFPRKPFGCMIDPHNDSPEYRSLLAKGFDFAVIPFNWQAIQPSEQDFNWGQLDHWVEWLTQNRIPIRGASVVALTERDVPPWLYVWEHDFETIRDLMYEHVKRVVNRYGSHINTWDIVSGVHANNTLALNFEQIMEITRMTVAVTKQLSPRSQVNIDLTAPWGEYYARNQRTIPPLLYADMAVQSGLNFDGFGMQIQFGVGLDGFFMRDMFQISALLDRFSSLCKPLHISAVQVPSSSEVDSGDAWQGERLPDSGGLWRGDWNEELQSAWLQSFCKLALSKPMVESITWRDLSEQNGHFLPHGGLLRNDLSPKKAFEDLIVLKQQFQKVGRAARKSMASDSQM